MDPDLCNYASISPIQPCHHEGSAEEAPHKKLGTHDKGEEKILNSAINKLGTSCGLSPWKAGEPQAADHNYTVKVMQMYGGRSAICREPSISSSYYSSSSAASSPPSADHQKGSSSNISGTTTTFHPSHIPSLLIGEDMLTQLHILDQWGHIGIMHSGTSSPTPAVSIPDFCNQQLINAQADPQGASHASHDHFYSGATTPALDCSTTNVAVSDLHQLYGTDQEQQHWDKNKMIESSCTGESTQGASTEFQNRLSSTSTDPAAGDSSRACREKRMEEQASASRLEAHESSSSLYINKGYNVGILDAAGGFNVARAHSKLQPFELDHGRGQLMVGLTSKAISIKPAGMASRCGAFRSWNRYIERKQKHSTARDSFLKKILIYYLPKQHRSESTVWMGPAIRRAGSPGPLMGYVQNVRGASGLLQAEEAQGASESTQNELTAAAVNHKFAERNRRRKQAQCYEALRSLVPNLAKKDKAALLHGSIQYLQELKERVCELEQEKATLIYTDNEDNKEAMRNSSHHTSSQATASSLCLPPSIFKDGNYFQLNVSKIIKYEEYTNLTNIEILSALQKKNLHCVKFKSEFEKSTSKFDVEILAQYKDGDNCTLSLNEKQEIEDWWPTFMKNLQIDIP